MNNKLYIIILLASSLVVHFLFFGNPREVVFDEVHYGKHVNDYINRTFHFDGHPPLARMSIAGFVKVFGYEPDSSFETIGEKYPDNQYLLLRLLPTLAGSLIPVIVFLIMLELGISPFASFVGGLLLVFDNGLLTQSRLLLMDAFLVLYGFTSLLFYLHYKNSRKKYFLILTGISATFAFSVKWVGLSFLGFAIIVEGLDTLAKIRNIFNFRLFNWHKVGFTILALGIIPLAVYFLIITAYSSILNRSGTGDAFMSPEYQKSIESGPYYNRTDIKPLNVFEKFYELNFKMYEVNQNLTATHPYSSPWYTWPVMERPIYYWVDSTSSPQVSGDARIYFIGNPIVWWGSTLGIIYGLWLMLCWFYKKILPDKHATSSQSVMIGTLSILLMGYILNLLPFVGIKRIMFLYHYLSALIFAVIILIYIIDKHFANWLEIRFKLQNNSRNILWTLLILVVISFIFFAPTSYGLNLSPSAYELRLWFSSWR